MADGLDLDPVFLRMTLARAMRANTPWQTSSPGNTGNTEDLELGRDEVEQVDGELLGVLEREGRVLVVDPCIMYCIAIAIEQ